MGKLLSYSIVSGMIMLTMYLVFKLFIARDNQHDFNRCILLLIYLVSFCAYPLYSYIDNLSIEPTIPYTTGIAKIENIAVESTDQPIWGTIFIWIFILGASLVAIKTILTWIRIVRVIHSGIKTKKDGFTLVIIDNDNIAPFSWMRYVVINSHDLISNNSAITTHELKHIRSFHWIDLLTAQLVCIINWFNPAAWLMREELMLVHEYQADMAVIDNGHNPQEYQMLLIKKAAGARFPFLANSINHSKLKKRITMMYKSKSGARSKLKAFALVPMFALTLGVATVPAVKAAVSTISNSELSLDKGKQNSEESPQFKITSLNNSGIETTVIIKGEDCGKNLSVSDVTFSNKEKDYSAKSLNTNMTDGQATITAVFPFSDTFENASVALNINGREVKLGLEAFRKSSQYSSVSISHSDSIKIYHGNAAFSNLGNVDIYLDGEKINEEQMKALNPDTISSVTVDKKGKVTKIIITGK